MPENCRTDEESQAHEFRTDDWPEPPGYLGEAVRRAKQIERTVRAMQQAPATD